jgi:hypothetical protein
MSVLLAFINTGLQAGDSAPLRHEPFERLPNTPILSLFFVLHREHISRDGYDYARRD